MGAADDSSGDGPSYYFLPVATDVAGRSKPRVRKSDRQLYHKYTTDLCPHYPLLFPFLHFPSSKFPPNLYTPMATKVAQKRVSTASYTRSKTFPAIRQCWLAAFYSSRRFALLTGIRDATNISWCRSIFQCRSRLPHSSGPVRRRRTYWIVRVFKARKINDDSNETNVRALYHRKPVSKSIIKVYSLNPTIAWSPGHPVWGRRISWSYLVS